MNEIPDLPNFDIGDIGLKGLDLDLGAFDLGGENRTVETRYVKPPLYVGKRRAPVMYDNAAELARDCGPAILDGETIEAVVSGNFIFGDLFEAFAVETNTFIDDITLSTLAMSPNNVDSFHNLLAGDYLGTLNIIVSDYWYAHNRAGLPYMYSQLDLGERFQLAVAGIHTKITLLRIGARKIVVHGSANLRSSGSIENFTVITDAATYDFHLGWHRTILDHYATVKSRAQLRRDPLFNLLTE